MWIWKFEKCTCYIIDHKSKNTNSWWSLNKINLVLKTRFIIILQCQFKICLEVCFTLFNGAFTKIKCAWNCNLDSMRQTALIHHCNSLAMLQETILHIRVKMASSNCFGTAKMFSSFTTLALKRLDFKINFHEMGSGREGVAAKDNFSDRCNSLSV